MTFPLLIEQISPIVTKTKPLTNERILSIFKQQAELVVRFPDWYLHSITRIVRVICHTMRILLDITHNYTGSWKEQQQPRSLRVPEIVSCTH